MFRRNLWIIAVVVVLSAAGLLFAGQMGPGPATAEAQSEAGAAQLPRTITVVGEATVNIQPDMAQVNIGVEIVEPDLQSANSQAAATINAIVAALKQQGVTEQNIQTSALNIWIERPYGPNNTPSDQVLYHVTNQVNVTVRDLANLAGILDTAIQAGANNMYGVTFRVADPGALESDARQQAIDDATLKAEELAQLAGLNLGEVVSVSEIIGAAGGGGVYNSFQTFGGEGMGGGGPISPGELQMTIQLQVVFNVQ